MTITEFLLARIGEDEREANVCLASPEHTTRRWTRVLAECAAKRALVDLAVTVQEIMEGEWGCGHRVTVDNADEWDRDFEGWEILQTLAAVYKDHPDYQPDWAL
jgi:hypothetical protein